MDESAAVTVLIPTYDEAETIGDLVDRVRAQGYDEVLVVDGGSTDGTREIAADHGARVVEQSGSGKGQAIRQGFDLVETPYVLMMDGDATYRPEQADRLLEPILAGEAEHVVGDRFAEMEPGAMTRLNGLGNRLINRAFATIHGRDYRDVLSGYRAFTRDAVRSMSLTEDGFGIETELSVECVKHGVPTTVVPITYEPRPAASETNLRPFRDGADILLTLYKMTKTNNPLFYFGSVGVASGLVGLLLAVYVAVEWLTRGVSHEVIAVVSGVAVLFGVQLVMFGVLSDLVVTLNREQTNQFERLARRMREEAVVESADADREAPPAAADGDPAAGGGTARDGSGEAETDRT